MKNFNSDSSSALSRFAKDKRLRTERVSSTRTSSARSERPKRASFNPNFTDDNRPKRGVEGGERSERKPFERKPNGRAAFGNKPGGRTERNERTERNFKGKSDSFKSSRKPMGKSEGFKKSEGYKGKGKPTAERSYPKYNPNKVTGEIRLNRFVAQSGLCSRREADDFIAAGLVSVNGVIVTELGTKVKPTDVVKFNDERLQGEKNVYLVLNKPKGYVTTLEDDHAEKTVMELVQNACKERIYPVGRLDRNTTGVLLLTNDGDLAAKLTHPKFGKKKIYAVTLDRDLDEADEAVLRAGITLDDEKIVPDAMEFPQEDRKHIGLEIHSGQNRVVRRMFEKVGYKVTKLDRVSFAGLTKKNVARGKYRFLTPKEVAMLQMGAFE